MSTSWNLSQFFYCFFSSPTDQEWLVLRGAKPHQWCLYVLASIHGGGGWSWQIHFAYVSKIDATIHASGIASDSTLLHPKGPGFFSGHQVTLGLDMCKVCTDPVHCVALWTRVTLGLDMCKVCTEAVHCVALWTRVTLGLDMCKVCTEAIHCVALWTRVTLGLDMCKVCAEAVHCVALALNTSYIRFGHV